MLSGGIFGLGTTFHLSLVLLIAFQTCPYNCGTSQGSGRPALIDSYCDRIEYLGYVKVHDPSAVRTEMDYSIQR